MAALGDAFAGGLWRRLYAPGQVPPLALSIVFALVLIVLNQLFQAICGVAVLKLLIGGDSADHGNLVKAYMIGLFPASLLTAACAFAFAAMRGGNPVELLALQPPRLSPIGWIVLTIGFLVALYAIIILVVTLSGIDLAQYAPTEGEDNSGSIGVVKQAMFDIAHDPRLFLLVLPSVTLGAPLAEELIFRGQLFNALAHSRAGVSGATLITAAGWAVLHLSETWFAVAMIFVMGLAFGYLIYRFGSLWVTFVCHAVWNSIYAMIMFGSVGAT